MKKITFTVVLLVTMGVSAFSQDTDQISRKEVLLYLLYNGKNKLIPKSEVKTHSVDSNGNTILHMNMAGDSMVTGMVPYNETCPMNMYLWELSRWPANYVYNNVFYHQRNSDSFMEELGMSTDELEKMPSVDIMKLGQTNPYYIASQGVVGQFWILDADWQVDTTRTKPRLFKQLASWNLEFDYYILNRLQKIHSITPVTKNAKRDVAVKPIY